MGLRLVGVYNGQDPPKSCEKPVLNQNAEIPESSCFLLRTYPEQQYGSLVLLLSAQS